MAGIYHGLVTIYYYTFIILLYKKELLIGYDSAMVLKDIVREVYYNNYYYRGLRTKIYLKSGKGSV